MFHMRTRVLTFQFTTINMFSETAVANWFQVVILTARADAMHSRDVKCRYVVSTALLKLLRNGSFLCMQKLT